MRLLGQILLTLGAVLGFLVGVAILTHFGPDSSWLVNVALAKLALVGAGGLMGAGAVALRLDRRDRSKQLPKENSDQSLPR